ncbi:MAG: CvpA family protein [Rectinema sp.]|nr:CvpA family protein [Rectinema sp.]
MNTLDWIFSAVVIVLAARCFVRGFVHEILSAASIGMGILAGLLFSNIVMQKILPKLGAESLPVEARYAIAFVLCFIAGFIIMKIIERMIREGLEASNLDIFDRILGLGLGILEGFIVVGLFAVILKIQPLFDAKNLLSGSLYYRLLGPLIEPAIGQSLAPLLKDSGLQNLMQNSKGK